MKYLLTVLLLMFSVATHADEPVTQVTRGLDVEDPVVRVPMPGRNVTVAFFTLKNRTDSERKLVGVSSPIAARAELHSHRHEDGMMRMRKEAQVAIPAQGELKFQPGGYHVMLFELRREPQTGDQVELVLTFDDNSQLVLDASTQSVFDRPHHNH